MTVSGMRAGRRYTTHGMSKTTTYMSYMAMMDRCYNRNRARWCCYGGRGIKICERWLGPEGFIHFYEDMGPRPTADHTIDRKHNDGDYEPGNCRWATVKEQSVNKRSTRMIEWKGKAQCIAEWAVEVGLSVTCLTYRLDAAWPLERAMTEPVRAKCKTR